MAKDLRIGMRILLGLVFCFMGCGDKIEPGTAGADPPSSMKAEIAVAEISTQPYIYEAVGTITAKAVSTLSGKIMGTVRAVNVKEGDRVRKDDVLMVLDKRQAEAGLRQSEAGFSEAAKAVTAAAFARNAAEAGAKLAEATYRRYQTLLKEESATRQEFDEAKARYLQAEAALSRADAMLSAAKSRVRQAEAGVSSANIFEKDATILAPYDGIITAKMISAGDLASPGTPLLTLEKTGGFQAELFIPEHHMEAVRIGQSMEVIIPAQTGSSSIKGVVETIFPVADARSRSFTIKVILPDTPWLRSGMFARINIPVGEGGMLLIPESAVVAHGQLTGFFMVDEDSIARFRLMKTGRAFKDKIEIISGMKPGTRYVVSPPTGLKNGIKIEDAS